MITALSMISQRNMIRSQHFVSIEFDVIGMVIIENQKQCRNRVKKIQMQMAALLGLHESLLEVIRPVPIRKGLKVHINIYISYTKAIDMNIERDINEAHRNREITEIIQKSWKLSANPTISNVKYTRHESKEGEKNAVFIGIINKISQINRKANHQVVVSEIAMSSVDVIDKDNDDDSDDSQSIEDMYDEGIDGNAQLVPFTTPDV